LNLILRILLSIIGNQAKIRLLREAKKRGVLVYLKTVQGTRRLLIGLLLGFFVLQMMVFAFVGALVSGLYLMDLQAEWRWQLIFIFCTVFFALPFLVLLFLFSERLWFKASGAQALLEDLRTQK